MKCLRQFFYHTLIQKKGNLCVKILRLNKNKDY